LKSGGLNLLEPSGPVQACNGIALPFFCDQALVKNKYERKTTVIVQVNGLFYKASHKSNPSSIPQNYVVVVVVVVVTGVEGFPMWGYSLTCWLFVPWVK